MRKEAGRINNTTENNNKENAKKFEENDLEKVDGGYAPACNSAEYELNNAIAQEERTRIADKSSIGEFRKQLAENGIDVDKIEKKMRKGTLSMNNTRGSKESDK